MPNNLESNIRDAALSESLSACCQLAQTVQPWRHPKSERQLLACIGLLTARTGQLLLGASSWCQASRCCQIGCSAGF